jgi:stage V sporulation protein B
VERLAVSRAVKLARTSTKGGFNLFWGVAVSSFISALGVMIVAGILSEGEYGLYTIALIVPNFVSVIRGLGVDQSTIKYTAQYNEERKPTQIRKILAAAFGFELIFGLILTAASFFLSAYLATEIFHRPEITPFIQIASFTVFGGALFKTAESAFIGYEQMQYNSLALVIQSVLKTALMIILVVSGFGVYGAVIGNTVGWLIAGLFGVVLLYFVLYKNLRKQDSNKLEVVSTLKKMLRYGLPLSGSTILNGLRVQFFAFLVAIYLTDKIVGNYQVAMNFSVLVSFYVIPVQNTLFPAFSKINAQKEPDTLRNVFQFSVKYSSLLIVPATFMIMALSQPAVATIFQGKYELTPLFLSIYLIIYLFTAFGYFSSDSLIKGQGKSDFHLKLGILRSILAVILSLILTPLYGVIGLISANLISTLPQVIISLWWINKNYNATIDWKSSTKILIASFIAAVFTFIVMSFLNLASWLILIVGAIIYAIVYLVSAPLIGAINRVDARNLREMLKALGPLAPIFYIPVSIIEKLVIIFHRE